MDYWSVNMVRMVLILGVVWGGVAEVRGQVIRESVKFSASDGSQFDWFGVSVAISDGRLIMGSINDDDLGSASGSVYVFDEGSGDQVFKLLASDGTAGDHFGHSLAVDQGVLVVGVPEDDSNGALSGSVYIFDLETGVQTAKLVPHDVEFDDRFGWSVAVDNGIVAVGSKFDDDLGVNSGSVYLYSASSGELLRKVLPDDGEASDFFGWSVDLDNGVLAVGALFDDESTIDSGSVYLFDVSSGNQLGKLLPEPSELRMQFGVSISIDDGIVAVGADRYGSNYGSVFLFDVETGDQLYKLHPDEPNETGLFGIALDLEGSVLVVGGILGHGLVYVFDATTGEQVSKLLPDPIPWSTGYGESVSISNGKVVVGASADNEVDDQSGSAFLFSINACICHADLNSDGSLNFLDVSEFLSVFVEHDSLADFDSNGSFNFLDVSAFLSAFAEGCP